jgi:pilus assembly protein Flp/PilA
MLMRIWHTIRYLIEDDCGATAIEYGLICALVAVAIIGAVGFVGSQISNGLYTKIGNAVSSAVGG